MNKIKDGRGPQKAPPDAFSSIGVRPLSSIDGKTVVRSEIHCSDFVLATKEAELLFECRDFLPLADHVTGKVPRAGFRKKHVETVLHKFREYRLLVTRNELREKLRTEYIQTSQPRENTVIDRLGIPTKNRHESLLKACTSYIDNLKMYGRSARVCVVDDARSELQAQRTLAAISSIDVGEKLRLVYMNRTGRRKFARKLALMSGVSRELVEFAILGGDEIEHTYGAARNTLLLLTPGHLTLQVDDDTECVIKQNRAPRKGLHIASKIPLEFWYMDTLKDSDNLLSPASIDLLEHHESMLGKSIASISQGIEADDVAFGAIQPSMVKYLLHPGARIVVSQNGWYGDAAVNSAVHRLSLDGASFDRLTRSASSFLCGKSTRFVVRSTARFSIANCSGLMGVNMGLDNRNVLPPFMPVGRNEDAVFGQMLHGCFKRSFTGHLPEYHISHAPPGPRKPPSLAFQPLTGNGVVRLLLASLAPDIDSNPVSAMLVIASGLKCITSSSDSEFEAYVSEMCSAYLIKQIHYMEFLLDSRHKAPGYWKKEVQIYLSQIKEALLEHRVVFTGVQPESRRREIHQMRRLLFNYASLLECWPSLYKCARTMADSGDC